MTRVCSAAMALVCVLSSPQSFAEATPATTAAEMTSFNQRWTALHNESQKVSPSCASFRELAKQKNVFLENAKEEKPKEEKPATNPQMMAAPTSVPPAAPADAESAANSAN